MTVKSQLRANASNLWSVCKQTSLPPSSSAGVTRNAVAPSRRIGAAYCLPILCTVFPRNSPVFRKVLALRSFALHNELGFTAASAVSKGLLPSAVEAKAAGVSSRENADCCSHRSKMSVSAGFSGRLRRGQHQAGTSSGRQEHLLSVLKPIRTAARVVLP